MRNHEEKTIYIYMIDHLSADGVPIKGKSICFVVCLLVVLRKGREKEWKRKVGRGGERPKEGGGGG